MSTLELLLAFQLRGLAADLRSAARASFYSGIFETCDEPQRREQLAKWDREHPIARFIPIALEEVEQVADHVRELIAES